MGEPNYDRGEEDRDKGLANEIPGAIGDLRGEGWFVER